MELNNHTARGALIAIASISLGCSSGERRQITRQDTSFHKLAAESVSVAFKRSTDTVRLLVDSSAPGVRIEIKSGTAIVHLPAKMAGLLFDSLPGFAPFSKTDYDSNYVNVAWPDESDSANIPSAVIGDFDGDGKSDVALIGFSHDSTAVIMLLTNATTALGPRLLFLGPKYPAGKSGVVLRIADRRLIPTGLPRDGVEEESIGQGAVVFYLDRGVLRFLQTSD